MSEGMAERLARGALAYCHQLEYADVVVEKEFVEKTHRIYFAFPMLFAGTYAGVEFLVR